MAGRLRTLEELSRPKSGACLDNDEARASVDYDYWIAWMRYVEALSRADEKRVTSGE